MQNPIQKNWQIAERLPAESDQALAQFSPPFRQILFNRDCKTLESAQNYLEARCPDGCEPSAMLGIEAAVDRIQHAIRTGEQIAVYGDYDADGVTATALLTQALQRRGARVRGYIPNRFDEGYGLNMEALDALKTDGVSVVVTVDCGVRSLPEAAHGAEIGLDLIITDHHMPGPELPVAHALVNPKQPGDTYPEQDLAGVGLAYKLVTGLMAAELQAALDQPDAGNGDAAHVNSEEEEYLDLVALGTVADLAPLTGENRHLVRRGLQRLARPSRQGVMSLLGVCGFPVGRLEAEQISFALGPRLNAAGRLDSALAALKLLLASQPAEAAELAQALDNQNRERQQITRDIQIDAEKRALENDPDCLLLLAVNESYNPGVIGLAASRLSEQYYRPAIVAHMGEEFTRGSCRSIPEFHITEALDECADLLVRHGGHAAAAGFTVRNNDLPELIERMRTLARLRLGALDLHPTLKADVETPLAQLKPDLIKEMRGLQPTGASNSAATFVTRGARLVRSKVVGKDSAHLKLSVTDGRITYDAIAFRLGHLQGNLPQYLDLMFRFEVNEFNGVQSLQLNVKDIKPAQ